MFSVLLKKALKVKLGHSLIFGLTKAKECLLLHVSKMFQSVVQRTGSGCMKTLRKHLYEKVTETNNLLLGVTGHACLYRLSILSTT